MIGKLSGRIDQILENQVIIDVGGVGYLVACSPATLSRIQEGESVSLLIDTNVREDAITLYGFLDASEQQWFRLLTSVQGVGAKAGMAILGVCPPDQLGFAIASGDKAALTRADGVGPKLAARILTELKDKAAKIDLSAPKTISSAPIAATAPKGIENDAISALINLGYGRSDAYAAVLHVQDEANDNLQTLITLALKHLTA